MLAVTVTAAGAFWATAAVLPFPRCSPPLSSGGCWPRPQRALNPAEAHSGAMNASPACLSIQHLSALRPSAACANAIMR